MSNRDEQFSGFAKAVLQEIDDAIGNQADCVKRGDKIPSQQEFANRLGDILARRAYDLVKHTIENVWPAMLEMNSTLECVERIPDMPVLPEETE